MDQSSTASPGLNRVRPSVLAATCSSIAAGLESICLAGRGVFPAGLEQSRGAGGSPGPWPICSLFIFLHLSITSKINTPWCGGQREFPWQQRQDLALRVPSTPTPRCPPSRGCLAGLGSGLQPHAQAMSPPCCMSHARSRECLTHCLVLPSAWGSVSLAGSARRAVMPNPTMSWHQLKPAEGL